MNRFGLIAFAYLSLWSAFAPAEVKIDTIRASHGPQGPEHKNQAKIEVFPHEELYLRFRVTGVGIDETGAIRGTTSVRMLDAAGKEILSDKSPLKGVIALGGSTFPGTTRLVFGPKTAAGTYKVIVSIADSIREESAQFEREVIVKPATFAVINPRFFHDPEGRLPAPLAGQSGQMVFFRCQLIGFDVSQKKIRTKMTMQFIDKNGRETMPQPLTATAASDRADEVAQATVLNYNGSFVFNRAGEFTLRFTFTDEIGQKETKLELPVRVTE